MSLDRAARLILASASVTRAEMLRAAGLSFEIDPADIDEASLRHSLRQKLGQKRGQNSGITADSGELEPERPEEQAEERPEEQAEEQAAIFLAESKALKVSADRPASLVIGADQILGLDGAWLEKPPDIAAARAQLARLSGRRHRLVSAVAVATGGQLLWSHAEAALMVMRPLSEGFLDHYLALEGDAVCASVGAYRLEGLGAQLFSRVDGDFFTVLGLPLLALLDYLRRDGYLPS